MSKYVVEIPGREEPGPIWEQQLRVAAYCRVSTDNEGQLSSLELQMAAFRTQIEMRPDWELVDIYADEGISGTRAEKRPEFQRMIRDCEAGKIDYIITKSISRFARNTVQCLQYIRHLQSCGVQLLFEKDFSKHLAASCPSA